MTKIRFIFTVALPIVASIGAGIFILNMNNDYLLLSRAQSIISSEKSDLNDEIDKLKDERDELEKTDEEYDQTLEENKKLADEIEALQTELDSQNESIEFSNQRKTELDEQIEERKKYVESSSTVTEEEKGEPKTYESGTYKCPADIAAGRYKVEGSGKILQYYISNQLRLSKDLATTEENYTIEIESGESLTLEGEFTISPLTSETSDTEGGDDSTESGDTGDDEDN